MKRIVGMILVVAMVAFLVIVSVFAADTREDEMPATCIAEITESGEVIYYVEDEPKENDEATAPATWVADVDEDEEDSPIIIRAMTFSEMECDDFDFAGAESVPMEGFGEGR